ncbi:hypothetical protein [Ramlibacter sp. AN1133]|uniref:hypothetical protein n=1 Tax=Ramlibacter sp. AN1133 TaxID=3133429 RepID=UPI0030C2BC12
MHPFATHAVILDGEDAMRTIAHHLVDQSIWFAVTPLPDDQWELEVKEGEQHRVQLDAAKLPKPRPMTQSCAEQLTVRASAWDKLARAFIEHWSSHALDGGVDGLVGLVERLSKEHPSRASHVHFGGWELRRKEGASQYLYASRPDKQGEIHLKAAADGFVVDVWTKGAGEVVASTAAAYTDLGENPDMPDLRRFGDLAVGDWFFDGDSGEEYVKSGNGSARFLTGGDAFEGSEATFQPGEVVDRIGVACTFGQLEEGALFFDHARGSRFVKGERDTARHAAQPPDALGRAAGWSDTDPVVRLISRDRGAEAPADRPRER